MNEMNSRQACQAPIDDLKGHMNSNEGDNKQTAAILMARMLLVMVTHSL
jgi:hypothetical protein